MQTRTELVRVRAFVFFVSLRFVSVASLRLLLLRAGKDDFTGGGSRLSAW